MQDDIKQKSDTILEKIHTRLKYAQSDTIQEEKRRLVISTVQQHLFAFWGDDIKEILPLDKIAYVPGCPDFILGIINVRGDIESVLNIHRLMGFQNSQITWETRIVMAQKEGIRSGIMVDSVEDIIEISADLIKPPISTLDKSLREFIIGGERLYRNQYVSIIDIGKIFNFIIPENNRV